MNLKINYLFLINIFPFNYSSSRQQTLTGNVIKSTASAIVCVLPASGLYHWKAGQAMLDACAGSL